MRRDTSDHVVVRVLVLEEKAVANTSFILGQKRFRSGVPYVPELLHAILHQLGHMLMREAKLSPDEVRGRSVGMRLSWMEDVSRLALEEVSSARMAWAFRLQKVL